jgi:8-oxo-dGTP pyrophosphatase MutT (NUDIX family)
MLADRRAQLLDELARHAPADERESECLEQIRALVQTAPDPFTRAERDHVTGSAIIARPGGEAFLLIHHRRLDRWLQPGGHVDPGDPSVFDAARREAREETGVSALEAPFGPLVLDLDVHPIPASADRPEHVHFDLRFLLTTRAESFAVQAEEVRRAAWFSLEEALTAGVDASLARALRKAARCADGRGEGRKEVT